MLLKKITETWFYFRAPKTDQNFVSMSEKPKRRNGKLFIMVSTKEQSRDFCKELYRFILVKACCDRKINSPSFDIYGHGKRKPREEGGDPNLLT